MKLKILVNLRAGHPIRRSIENTPNGEVAIVQMKDVDAERGLNINNLYQINLLGRKKPDYLSQGDILFVGRGYRTYAVLVEEDLNRIIAGPHFFIMRTKDKSVVHPDYLVWYINHFRAQKYFLKHLTGSALPHINRHVLEELPVIVPPLLVQEQIVSAHRCRLKEKILLEKLIARKKCFLDELLDKTLEHHETHGNDA